MAVSRFLKSQRMKRRQRVFPISSFSIFLLGFGLVYWNIHGFTLLSNHECRYALIWVGRWFDFASLFQVLAVVVGLITVLFVVRLISRFKQLNLGETVFQAAMVAMFIAALATQKAFLFPQASPSWAQVEQTAGGVLRWNSDLILIEEFEPLDFQPKGFPPPDVEFREDPRFLPGYDRRLSTIFVSKSSPLWSEYKALHQCDAEMISALAQWEKDQLVLEQYWKDYRAWAASNSPGDEASN